MAPELNNGTWTTSKRAAAKPSYPLQDASNKELGSSSASHRKLPVYTKTEPFRLATEERAAMHNQQVEKLSEDEKQEEAVRMSHTFQDAKRHDWTTTAVKPVSRFLTVPEPFEFASEERCRQRAEFDRRIQAKIVEAELAARLAAEEAQRREEEERQQLRKAATFRARPMPDLTTPDPVARPPPKPTTRPVSPRLGRGSRGSSM